MGLRGAEVRGCEDEVFLIAVFVERSHSLDHPSRFNNLVSKQGTRGRGSYRGYTILHGLTRIILEPPLMV